MIQMNCSQALGPYALYALKKPLILFSEINQIGNLRSPNLRVFSEKHRRLIDTRPWRAVLIYGDSTQESRLERQCRSWIHSCMETARTSFNAGDKTDLKSLPKTASSSRIRAAGSFSSTMYFQALIWERHVAYSESESVKTSKFVQIRFEAGQFER